MRGFIGSFGGHEPEHLYRFGVELSRCVDAISIRSVAAAGRRDPDALPTSFEEPEHGLRGAWHRLDAIDATTAAWHRVDAVDATPANSQH